MKKVIIIGVTFLVLSMAPLFILISMFASPISFVNSLFSSDDYTVEEVCELADLHYETDEYLNDYQDFYKPIIDEAKNSYDVTIPLKWLVTTNLSAEIKPDINIVNEQVEASIEKEEIYDAKGNVIDIIYSLTDIDIYLNRLKQQNPWRDKWYKISVSKVKELIDCSSKAEQMGQGGIPENLDELLENYSFSYPFEHKANINAPFGYSAIYGTVFHNGIDLGFNGVYGEPIYSSTEGIVTFSGVDPDGANVVLIRYGELSILYGHMENRSPLSVGDAVVQGDFIGTVGSTGNSTGPHLHFEIQQGSHRYDPALFIDF